MTATSVDPGYAVAAVDGTQEAYAAVSFGVEKALRLGLELRLAHVMPVFVPVAPLLMGTDRGLGGYASETLASAARVAAEAAPQLAISTHVLMGSRVSEIVDLAEHARFIAVGRRQSSALDRACSGGTLNGVEIEVVHAWKLPSGYDDMIARRVSEATLNREQGSAMREVLGPWQEAYLNVPVRIRVVHEYPRRALAEASREADRLVLVKPVQGSLLHHHGRTARAVLSLAQCPVEVVPARPRGELIMAPVAVEQEGELVP